MPSKSLQRLVNRDGPMVVLDLEATCAEDETVPKREMEIIEIGAVAVDAGFEPFERFQAYVRPVRHPKLTDFCRNLTGISQGDVDAAPTLPEVLDSFRSWLESMHTVLWSSWGRFDRMLFERDFKYHGVKSPLPGKHVNLRECFEETVAPGPIDFASALSKAGIAFEGQPHRGLDDAVNTARLLPLIMANLPAEGVKENQ